MSDTPNLMDKVRKALGRTAPLSAAPVPPVIGEPITRLVHSDIGLPELFAKSASDAKFKVEPVSVDDLGAKLTAYLKEKGAKRIGMTHSPLLEKLNLYRALQIAGLDVKWWSELTLDESYDLDCGITDVYAAVAETGSLVIRPSPGHGRALSLVPPLHIAILEPKNFVADLIDLFERLAKEAPFPNVTLITGPSKTADIEGNLVTGVHGPGIVKLFILQ
jgi:L-lactate utilization protein LutC